MIRIYVRASTKEQDAERALDDLIQFSKAYGSEYVAYVENESGTKLNRPVLNRLLDESMQGDILLVESVDRLSRLEQSEFEILKQQIKAKGLRLIVADLPTTHTVTNGMTGDIMTVINSMLIDLLATMAKLDNDKRRERIKQGMAKSNYKPTGKKPNKAKHQQIIKLLEAGTLSKPDIAKLTDTSLTTIYRIVNELKDSTKEATK